MSTFAIVHRPDGLSESIGDVIRRKMIEEGYKEEPEKPETVFVVGGDGTFLNAVHHYLDVLDDVRFCGIHTGTLGFYTDYQDVELNEFISDFLSGKGEEIRYPLLEVNVDDDTYFALNEMRVENNMHTQTINVFVDGIPFETCRGNGLCVATQVGSTAYNRSLGGAVIQEGLNLIEMTEIAGIHHSQYHSLEAPIIMRGETVLQFYSDSYAGTILGIDSDWYPLDKAHAVKVRISPTKGVRMLKGKQVSYFKRLQSLF